MTTPRSSTTIAAVLSSLLVAVSGCGPTGAVDGPEASEIGTDTAAIDSSFLPKQFQTRWSPGIPGGVPRDNDPVRPATVWLPSGNPYGGYSVNPALAGQGNAAAFTSAMQAAINAAGAAATPSSRKIVLLKAGTYYVTPQNLPNKGGQVGLYVTVDNVTIRGEGADRTRLVANGTIPDYGTVVLFGHRGGFNDGDFRVTAVTSNAWMSTNTIPVADASRFAVGDVITIDMLDGAAVPTGSVQLNASFLWFYDGEYFKRQPTFSWAGPSTGAPGINVGDLASANAAAFERRPALALVVPGRRDHRHQRKHPLPQGAIDQGLHAVALPAGLADGGEGQPFGVPRQPLVGDREHRRGRRQQPVGLPWRDDRLQLHVLRLGQERGSGRLSALRFRSSREGRLQHRAGALLSLRHP
jgi:hypothetical protein